MKTTHKIIILSIICSCLYMNSYAQMHGIYTVGNGGTFPTIQAAVNAAVADSVDGPVFFQLISGIYVEQVTILPIPGASLTNTITIESQTGNPQDVTVVDNYEVFTVRSDFITFRNLTISSTNAGFGIIKNIKIINNLFSGNAGIRTINNKTRNVEIIGNQNVAWIILGNVPEDTIRKNVKIINNSIIANILLLYFDSCTVENNSGFGIIAQRCNHVNIIKNKFSGDINVHSSDNSKIINNFGTSVQFYHNATIFQSNNCLILNNTFVYKNSQGIGISGLNNLILNNIFIHNTGGLVLDFYTTANSRSDYNNFFNGGNAPLIKKNNVAYNDLNAFTSATGLDSHSNSHPVTFMSHTDLHLAGSSIGDQQLIGTPTPFVTDDIDGHPRNPLYPYKGADEADVPLPVELASFTSLVTSNNVQLKWTTNSEINNSGFDIERSKASNDWIKVGFINGNGTTNLMNNYQFTDKNLLPGKYNYRLKQIDFNGNFEYHNLSNEVFINIPTEFYLLQNYPNPFNPITNLKFGIRESGLVSLKVYDAVGKEVTILVNEVKSPGEYEVEFDGSKLSSGMYFYRLEVNGNTIDTKRMLLVK